MAPSSSILRAHGTQNKTKFMTHHKTCWDNPWCAALGTKSHQWPLSHGRASHEIGSAA
jgi:hypothetical protein